MIVTVHWLNVLACCISTQGLLENVFWRMKHVPVIRDRPQMLTQRPGAMRSLQEELENSRHGAAENGTAGQHENGNTASN